MQRAIVLGLFLDLSVRAFGNECAPGHKHRADLTGLMCIDSTKDAASCDSECCEKDPKTCGGLTDISCAWGSYAGGDDAWKKKAATNANKNTACCAPKATCGSSLYSCPSGKMKDATKSAMKCASDATSCVHNTFCCKPNPATCGGQKDAPVGGALNCAGTKYEGSGDAWRRTACKADGTDKGAKCCLTKATCASAYTVPAGYKKTGPDGQKCLTDAASCAKPTNNPTCVGKDNTKCGGQANDPTCTKAAHYYPKKDNVWKNKVFTNIANIGTECCTPMATCKQATCPSGYKKKAKVEAVTCPGDVASCTTDVNTCCEKDTTKCGGLSAISCKYGFFDEREMWTTKTTQATKDAWKNKAANSTNKNANCCTPRTQCALPVPGTTTPAPLPGTTTPALKYSEHKIAVKEGSDRPWGANMVWLGVGGVIGMGILMVMQGLRSKMQAAEHVDGEDAELLINTHCG